MDTFHEQFLPTSENGKYKSLKMLFYVGIVITILAFMINIFFAIPFAIITAIIFLLKRNAYEEFEYELTCSEFDISAIYEKTRRKKLTSFDVKSISLMAPINSSDLKSKAGSLKGEIFYTNMNKENEVFGIVINKDGAKKLYLIAPNSEFINACFTYNPRAVKKY